MKREDVRKVSLNHCLYDDELAEADRLCREAEPGAWRVVGGAVCRFGAGPVTERGSVNLMAASVTLVPRLVKGVRVLEEALRCAWADAAVWKREAGRERDAKEATARRGKAGQRADGGLAAIAELIKLSPGNLDRAADLLDRHSGGEDVAALLAGELDWLRKQDQEAREAREAIREEEIAAVQAARQILAERKAGRR